MPKNISQLKRPGHHSGENLSGQKIGYYSVLTFVGHHRFPCGQVRAVWRCRCVCGVIKDVFVSDLKRRKNISCGCQVINLSRKAHITHGATANYKRSREYRSWQAAKRRCTVEHDPKYPRYGGRGIFMHERWLSDPSAFLRDMGSCPPKHTLDRINNDGPYAPGNCRWATAKTQARNKRPKYKRVPTSR